MTILKDISIIWSFLHILVLFLFLFESRYSKRKTILITAVSMIPLIAVNFVLFFILGMEKYLIFCRNAVYYFSLTKIKNV